MGEVILGMPGPWAKDYREAADHYTTKIGGFPDWPIPEVDVRPDFLECGACGSRLCLVVQLYAPVFSDTVKIEERVIYVFGCSMQKCGSNPLSWRALRVQKTNNKESSVSSKEVTSSGRTSAPISNNKWLEDIWSDDCGDDVNNDDVDMEKLSRALSEASHIASLTKKQNSRQQPESVKTASPLHPIVQLTDLKTPVVPCFYIYPQDESLPGKFSVVCSNISSLSIKENAGDTDDQREEEKWEEEGYEYDRALFVDRTYMKFKKRLDVYPEQCFRHCGASRYYEMQLMPPLLFFLREASDGLSTLSPEHWEWMTLFVYTCSKNCSYTTSQDDSSSNDWTVAEETVILQFE
ncbi:hypothetical protein IFM89_021685 [Coptis chinensis]|uniref:Programmed cell death protein 2 C-terminal domain-containing protein n=1 Tax=Coptis chinensis TaxID=261450 RepID=A0A835M607_9MAGN|nr:hypothetical protein IFM89_021685 [Coptis chinensis]